jgi:hypothetical protein
MDGWYANIVHTPPFPRPLARLPPPPPLFGSWPPAPAAVATWTLVELSAFIVVAGLAICVESRCVRRMGEVLRNKKAKREKDKMLCALFTASTISGMCFRVLCTAQRYNRSECFLGPPQLLPLDPRVRDTISIKY